MTSSPSLRAACHPMTMEIRPYDRLPVRRTAADGRTRRCHLSARSWNIVGAGSATHRPLLPVRDIAVEEAHSRFGVPPWGGSVPVDRLVPQVWAAFINEKEQELLTAS